MPRERIPRFRSVDPHTIGGGWDIRDMFRFSNRTWIVIRFVQLWFRHRILSLVIILFLYSCATEESWWGVTRNMLLAFSVVALFLYAYTYYKYSYAPTPWRLTQAIRRRWYVHKKWPSALKAAGFDEPVKIKRVRYTPNGIVGLVPTDKGRSSEDLADSATDIAAVLRAHEVKVNSNLSFEAGINIIWGDPTSRILYPEDITEKQTHEKGQVVFSLDSDHHPVEVSVTTSILVVGESESGKSNCFWSILNGLNEKSIYYKLRVIDPAGGVELSSLERSPHCIDYVDRAGQSADELLTRAHSDMMRRLEELKAIGSRKYENSENYPLNIIVVDELLLLSRYDQHTTFGEILSSGRKAGYIVIALSQLSQVDALGRIRDLFPQRICHATKSAEMTDAALGSGAELAGAKCSRIPKSTPGVGYFFSTQTRLYTRFRTPLITDDATKIIASGHLIQKTITGELIKQRFKDSFKRKRKTCVYRYYGYYNGEYGRLLYVGVAFNPIERWEEHRRDPKESWTEDVDFELTDFEWFPERKLALAVEKEAIETEFPVYNKQHRTVERV